MAIEGELPTTLDSILVSRALNEPNHRFLLRPEKDSLDTSAQPITYGTFDAHVGRLARKWTSDERASIIRPRTVVGVFFPSGYTLAAVMFALMRLGAVPFCISIRNSDEAIRHLLKVGHVVAMVASKDDRLSERIAPIVELEGNAPIPLLEVEKCELQDMHLTLESGKISFPPLPPGAISVDDAAIMQHTSGSTAFPKPVPLSNKLLIRSLQGGTWWVDDLHTRSDVVLGQPPIFHMFGLIGGLLNSLFRGHTFAIPPLPAEDNNSLIPGPQTLRTYALQVGATEFFGVSSSVVGLARSKGGIDLLKSLKRVLVSGAPMPRENGDWIVQQGIHLVEGVGSTEGGSLLHSNRPHEDLNWQAMRVCWNVDHHFAPFGPGVYELILHSSELSGKFPGSDPQTGHLSTHDLFQEYPEPGSNTWRHCGRSDDVLLLSSGQNWNPRPMELQIEGSQVIQHAVIFGHARPFLGVLIAPRVVGELTYLHDELRGAIWMAVEVANAVAPSNARIARCYVIVLTAKGVVPLDGQWGSDIQERKKIPLADKGTPLRSKTYTLFKNEIDAVYSDVF
ncbi:acetyl-CoA synthetase-like protein [Neolentinus lepideus HHB14362 ss-1]|uniref:Acetyl-CoA synthetase-like protein n=1 Tax=Neolentinus lepideus HHB14362 ss-1 TaxID=1314782 RepID=A0A165RQF4_9AGAM|nr:acetyl-CoA synthetase-like protein [Neolentinus lepideus HHB14362 ss-1]